MTQAACTFLFSVAILAPRLRVRPFERYPVGAGGGLMLGIFTSLLSSRSFSIVDQGTASELLRI
ncbi:hypothetical protein WP1_051 [Pseudomonas phage WP1]